LAQLVQEKVKQLPQAQLVALAKQMMSDMRAKDIQVYVANQQLEDLLVKRQLAAEVDTTPTIDSYMLVQANVSVAKSTPYVSVSQRDDITLDAQGGAYHQLTISLRNDPTGPIYGSPTYRDYIRIYVPPQAHFLSGGGFNRMQPMCYTPPPLPPSPPAPPPVPTPDPSATPSPPLPTPTPPPQYAGLPTCPASPYASGERSCPASAYASDGGAYGAAYTVLGAGTNTVPVLDALGSPPNRTSDLPGRAMWGGYVIIPAACTATVRVSWYVPGVVHG
jgi:hypothetical protein